MVPLVSALLMMYASSLEFSGCDAVRPHSLDEGDPGPGQVYAPHVQSLVLVKTLVKLVGREAFGEYALPGVVKPHRVWISHLPDDAVDGIDGPRTPETHRNKPHLM